ncbi:MAG: homoserine O-acetyltransferase, partial [Sphingobium sp.]
LTEKFGRRLQGREAKTFGFDADFQIESYLRHQGISFVERFDANSYLYITRATDYFDLAEDHGGSLALAFARTRARFCLISFDTDWLYPTAQSRHIVHALNAAGAAASFVELRSPFGHDAFLLEAPAMNRVIDGFLRAGE